jgi:hypothetical protein
MLQTIPIVDYQPSSMALGLRKGEISLEALEVIDVHNYHPNLIV